VGNDYYRDTGGFYENLVDAILEEFDFGANPIQNGFEGQ
jgi:hypothetical protein